jgi:hypothetical protein
LIVSAVDAIGEIARCLRDADEVLFHKIRLSYFLQSIHKKCAAALLDQFLSSRQHALRRDRDGAVMRPVPSPFDFVVK